MKKLLNIILNLKMFVAGPGTVVNATANMVNAYTGSTSSYTAGGMTPTLKTFYDTELLENHREKLIFAQLGQQQALPAHRGKVIEWRKLNTLPLCDALTEGVIPDGKEFGITNVTVTLAQYGEYVTISDVLELHALDDMIAGAVEEIGAASGKTHDLLVRNVLMTGSNILFADSYNGTTFVETPSDKADLISNLASYKCDLTPDMINKAVTNLQVGGAPTFEGGKYVAVIHPHVAYALRSHPDWIEAHKYAAPEQIFSGEIGELHGVRFIVSNLAPIIKDNGDAKATYKTMFFGKNAFAVVDPESAGIETIIKQKGEIGGPLEQFSTVGTKFEMAAKILYQERMVTVWSGSPYSATDSAN